jgi:S-disulfanyl-L-cysteine oxidoreductase SoxD
VTSQDTIFLTPIVYAKRGTMAGCVRVRPWHCGAVLGVAGFICALAGSAVLPVHAQQRRSVTDGVYTNAQAARGEAVYQKRCASCHGAALGGNAGPPLAGQDFLRIWNGQPASDLFDKIHNTMPYDAPRTLTRSEVADVVAYVLRANKLPAGNAELDSTDAALTQVSLAFTANAAPPGAAASRGATPALSFPPVGNVNQVMRGILFPSSNILFDVQTQDPSARKAAASVTDASTLTVRYGNVYDPWILVDVAAISLAESAPLLMTPGRRCENGKPMPIGDADWQKYVMGLVEAGRAAYKAAQTRNQETVSEVTNLIQEACFNCHRAYRDRRPAPMRCTAS